MFLAVGHVLISSSAPRHLGAAYAPILLKEVEQEQGLSGNGDHGAIVRGAGLCDSEGERAYTVYDPVKVGQTGIILNAFICIAGAKT